MTCVYNPLTSRELAWSSLNNPRKGEPGGPAAVVKNILVVGAGPAGMEFALTASARGHRVTVIEKHDRIGGQVHYGSASSLRKPWARIAEFYQRQADKKAFPVLLNTKATPESVKHFAPDAVVLATGSSPLRHALPGGRNVLTVHETLDGHANHARHAVVLDREGFFRPWVAADHLSSRGTTVHFVTNLLRLGPAMEGWMLDEMYRQLLARNVHFHVGKDVAEWHPDGTAILRDVQTAAETPLHPIDAITAAVGSSPENTLAAALRPLVKELHTIGDANTPATVEAATFQGANLGRTI